MISTENFILREYQKNIVETCKKNNTLVVVPTGLGKCCTFETPILLDDGTLIEIGKLFEINQKKFIKDTNKHKIIQPNKNIYVRSLNNKLNFEKDKIEGIHKIYNNKKLIKIKTATGIEIIVTQEHPFLFLNNNLKWEKAKNLKKGGFIATPSIINLNCKKVELPFLEVFKEKYHTFSTFLNLKNSKIIDIKEFKERKNGGNEIKSIFITGSKSNKTPIKQIKFLDKNLAYFLGLVIAEGRISGGIKFYNENEVVLKKFMEVSKKIFEITPKKINGGLQISSTAAYFFLKRIFNMKLNQHSREKTIEPIISKSPNEIIAYFIAGLYDGEGYISKKQALIEFVSASRDICNKLSYLLLRFGIKPLIKEKVKWATNSSNPKKRTYFSIFIEGKEDILKFYKKIPIMHPKKKALLQKIINNKKTHNTNRNLINISQKIRDIRNRLRLVTWKKEHINLKRVDMWETGRRKFSKSTLKKVIDSFERKLQKLDLIKRDIELFIKLIKILQLKPQFYNKQIMDKAENIRKVLNKSKISFRKIGICYIPTTKSTTKKKIKYLKEIVNEYKNQIKVKDDVNELKIFISNEIYWDKIKEISYTKSKWVYDLTLNKNFNYIAGTNGGLVSHNTAIAIALTENRINLHPDSKVLILAPSKPLCNQHIQTFKKNTTLQEDKILLLTGAISPSKRENLWTEAQVIIATPQTIQKDLENKRISLKEFSLLVIDECHRSREKFANTIVTKYYCEQSRFPRILALTASPGSTREKIKEICDHLRIEAVEIRSEQDDDVKEFVQEKKIEWITVELPKEFRLIETKLKNVYKEKLVSLEKFGIRKNATKRELLALQIRLQKTIKKSFSFFYGISLVAQVLKLNYAIELLETQGLKQLQTYWDKLKGETTKAAQSIIKNQEIVDAMELTNKFIEINHPKLEKIRELLINNFKQTPDSRVIIFANYRNTIDVLMEELNKLKEVNAINLVGQKEGLTQKEQINRIKQFAEGTFNTLICTNIGEEGLDIATADFAIFYEPVPSEIRTIQRKGRVARITKGKIIFLITKGTRDEAYYWSSKRKEKSMKSVLYGMKNNLEKQDTLFSK